MPRTVTLRFEDNSQHVYHNVPDSVSPTEITTRATQEFSKKVSHIDGGGKAAASARNYGQEDLSAAGRALALIPKAAIEGATGLSHLVADPFVNLARQAGLPKAVFPTADEQSAGLGTVFGQPTNPSERVLSDVVSGMTGALTMGGAARTAAGLVNNPMAKQMFSTLGHNLPGQVMAGGTGALAGGIAREKGASPGVQTAVNVLGSLAPSGTQSVKNLASRMAGNKTATAAAIKDATKAGTTLSVGQATQASTPKALESVLGSVFPSHETLRSFGLKQSADIGQKMGQLADELSVRGEPFTAGNAIKHGIDNFLENFKAKEADLYGELDSVIRPQTDMNPQQTVATLKKLSAIVPRAKHISKGWLVAQDAKKMLADVQDDLRANLNPGQAASKNAKKLADLQAYFLNPKQAASQDAKMLADVQDDLRANPNPKRAARLPYEALKRLRTVVGAKLGDRNLSDKSVRDMWSSVYAAISDDTRGLIAELDGPSKGLASKLWKRANAFTRAGHKRINEVLNDVIGVNKTAEEVYKTATNPAEMRAGASKISALLRSLPETDRKLVQSAVVRNLGRAPAASRELGQENWSFNTFLTQWNDLDPKAKSVLFNQAKIADDLDAIARTASRLRASAKTFANTSGTAQKGTAIAEFLGLGKAAISADPGLAATILAGMYGAHAGANLMTNPDFVRRLATGLDQPTTALPAFVNALATAARRYSPADKEDAQRFIGHLSGDAPPIPDAPR